MAHWREVASRTVMKVDMEPLGDSPFHCEAVLRALPALGLASFDISPSRVTRSRAMLADGNDDLILVLSAQGSTMMSTHGRDIVLGEGDATLMSSSEASITHIRTAARFHSLALRASRLAPMVADLDSVLAVPIPRGSDSLRLLTHYVESLGTDVSLATPELRQLATAHIYDLVALTLGATRDAATVARVRGAAAAKLRSIKADIVANAGKAVSIEQVAQRHGISPRYVRRLFERTGTTFTEYALEQRLLQAHRMLNDPRHDRLPIGTIAQDTGFGDLSYFNRAFRRRFGATPSDVRVHGRKDY